MPIGFPSDPVVDQEWPTGSPIWRWSGSRWEKLASAAPPAPSNTTRLALVFTEETGTPPEAVTGMTLLDSGFMTGDASVAAGLFLVDSHVDYSAYWYSSIVRFRVIIFEVEGSVREAELRAITWSNEDGGVANLGTPSLVAVEGDTVESYYIGHGGLAAFSETISAGFTRVRLSNSAGWPAYSASRLRRENAPAGATGLITHGADHAWSTRILLTLIVDPTP